MSSYVMVSLNTLRTYRASGFDIVRFWLRYDNLISPIFSIVIIIIIFFYCKVDKRNLYYMR